MPLSLLMWNGRGLEKFHGFERSHTQYCDCSLRSDLLNLLLHGSDFSLKLLNLSTSFRHLGSLPQAETKSNPRHFVEHWTAVASGLDGHGRLISAALQKLRTHSDRPRSGTIS